MTESYTKGPLTVEPPVDGYPDADYGIFDGNGNLLGDAYATSDGINHLPAERNARLWSVAPEMVELFKVIKSHFYSDFGCRCEGCRTIEQFERIIERVEQ